MNEDDMKQDISCDRELLELAAKAAGIHLAWGGPEKDMPRRTDTLDLWNPLTDDGDALRLAVKLGEKFPSAFIGIFNRAAVPHVCASVTRVSGTEIYVEDDVGDDIYAATRRAIVRAAAEIGKGIPQQQPAAECVLEDNYYKTQAEAEERGRAAAEIGWRMEGGAK